MASEYHVGQVECFTLFKADLGDTQEPVVADAVHNRFQDVLEEREGNFEELVVFFKLKLVLL